MDMLSKLKKMELSQQVALYYLLFCVIGAIGLGGGIAYSVQRFLDTRSESKCLAMIGQETPKIVILSLQDEQAKLQKSLVDLHRQNRLLYAGVADTNNTFIAHTDTNQIGKRARKQIGQRENWGQIEAVRFRDVDDVHVCEYSSKLVSGEKEQFGSLILAVPEPTFWKTFFSSSQYIPIALLLPTIILGVGAFVIRRATKPIAAIETQLRAVSATNNVEDAGLHPLSSPSVAAKGWNRLVTEIQQGDSNNDEKLKDAVANFRQNRVEHILNCLPEGLAITDQENRIKMANTAFSNLVKAGIAEPDEPDSSHGEDESLVGADIEQFIALETPGEDRSDGGDAPSSVREITKRIGNQERILRVARHRVDATASNSARQQVWSVRDITQQKMTEQMRDDFLDCATHELRTPLSNIKAYAETLALSEVLDVEQQKEFCNTINAEATRLGRFIDDLLSISSVEAGSLAISRENVQVDRLMHDVLAKTQPLMHNKKIEFNFELPQKAMPEIFVDKDKLEVALVNLLGNAAKYTQEGGRVDVIVKNSGQQITFGVSDTGVGISEADIPRLFDKFFRSSDENVQNETGTGLGLSLANEIVRLHGGSISVESEIDKGSTFTIVLPVRLGGRR